MMRRVSWIWAAVLTALTALETFSARPTIPRTTSTQRQAAGKTSTGTARRRGPQGARGATAAQRAAAGEPGPARPASQDGINGHDAVNREAGQNGTANQNI
jgi:hypothetical protein